MWVLDVDVEWITRPSKTNATGECLTYHTESIKQTNTHGNRSIILAGRQELRLSTVKRRKLSWLSRVCHHDTFPKIVLQGTVDSSRRRGRPRPRKSWKYNINEWTGQSMSSVLRIADNRGRWRVATTDASVGVPRWRLNVTAIIYM